MSSPESVTTDDGRVLRDCPICGSRSGGAVLHANRMAAVDGVNLGYVVRECDSCGGGFADAIASADQYGRYYATCSKYDTLNPAQNVAEASIRRAELAARLVMQHRTNVGSVLDIGCGLGTLLDAFRRTGAQRLVGLDVAPNAPLAARTLYGLTGVQAGSMQTALRRPDIATFDVVCLTGVLEHLAEPGQALHELGNVMGEGALLLLEVPAVDGFMDGPFEPFGEFSLEHVNFFCASALSRLAASNGFRAVHASVEAIGLGVTKSLFALLQVSRQPHVDVRACMSLQPYVRACAPRFEAVVDKLAVIASATPFVIYGAGSQTARLLPALEARIADERILGIVDGNENLAGRTMGQWVIESPNHLHRISVVPVVVSSFRSEDSISNFLRSRYPNKIVRLYEPGN